jgi:uncharacterized membrane protein
MTMQRNTLLASFLIVLGAVLLMIGLVTPSSGGGGGMGGSGSMQTNYQLSNVLLSAAGAALCGIGVVLLLPREERYVPPTPIPVVVTRKEEVKADETPVGPEVGTDNLVLRLLNGDEREMFRHIVEAGGTVLQKDLITGLKWSDAKVSRNIDKLEQKGIVTKERSGSTNKIKVDLDMEK